MAFGSGEPTCLQGSVGKKRTQVASTDANSNHIFQNLPRLTNLAIKERATEPKKGFPTVVTRFQNSYAGRGLINTHPRPKSHLVGEAPDLVQHFPNIRHHILPIAHDLHASWGSQCSVQNWPILGFIDLHANPPMATTREVPLSINPGLCDLAKYG